MRNAADRRGGCRIKNTPHGRACLWGGCVLRVGGVRGLSWLSSLMGLPAGEINDFFRDKQGSMESVNQR